MLSVFGSFDDYIYVKCRIGASCGDVFYIITRKPKKSILEACL